MVAASPTPRDKDTSRLACDCLNAGTIRGTIGGRCRAWSRLFRNINTITSYIFRLPTNRAVSPLEPGSEMTPTPVPYAKLHMLSFLCGWTKYDSRKQSQRHLLFTWIISTSHRVNNKKKISNLFFRSRVPLFHRKPTSSDRPRPGPLQNTTLRLEMHISCNASQCLSLGQVARDIPVFLIPSHPKKNPTCSFCCPALPWLA